MSDEVVFKREFSDRTGWTDEPIWPVMERPYHMACCDCGLVHDIRFGVIRKARPRDLGGYRPTRIGRSSGGKPIYPKRDRAVMSAHAAQVTMNVRRNLGLTDALRAKDHPAPR